jgi:hypothetical protein
MSHPASDAAHPAAGNGGQPAPPGAAAGPTPGPVAGQGMASQIGPGAVAQAPPQQVHGQGVQAAHCSAPVNRPADGYGYRYQPQMQAAMHPAGPYQTAAYQSAIDQHSPPPYGIGMVPPAGHGAPPSGAYAPPSAAGYGMGYAGLAAGLPPHLSAHPAAAASPAGSAADAARGQRGGMSEVLQELANGGNGLSSLPRLLNLEDSEFWKGALVGAAAVLLLTNDSVQDALFKTGARAKDAVQSGADKLKRTAAGAADNAKT